MRKGRFVTLKRNYDFPKCYKLIFRMAASSWFPQ